LRKLSRAAALVFLGGIYLCCVASIAAAQTPDKAELTYLQAGQLLLDPGAGTVLKEKTLVLKDGRVSSVQDGYVTAPGATLIDLRDSFVLPGLIDGHVHLSYRDGRESLDPVALSPAAQAIIGVETAHADLMAGFTTVVDLGGENQVVFALRDASKAGIIAAPRILASGDYIVSTPIPAPYSHSCSGADECTRMVRDQVSRGADLIKVIATGGVLSLDATGVGLQFTEEELAAITRTAHSLGRKVMMHAHGTDGINAALRAGADSIEHGSYLDASSIALFKAHGAYLEPTLLAGATVTAQAAAGELPPATAAKARTVGPLMLGAAHRAYLGGVKMAFGTDTGVSAHGRNAEEFGLLVQAGVSPLDAVRMATVWGANRVGLSDEIGALKPGMSADIIAVHGDPLTDVSVLKAVHFVMKAGVVQQK
jgi:imidazolonepropionase-like amidohydrolase